MAADFRLAGSWLQRLQDETRTGEPVEMAEAFDRWVQSTFARYRDRVGCAPGEAAPGQAGPARRELGGVPVPLVAVHGDYATGNLARGAGARLGVDAPYL